MGTLRNTVKRALFGGKDLARFRPVALKEPQAEISVWLRGPDDSFDVTRATLIASAAPLTIGIAMEPGIDPETLRGRRCSLEFRESVPSGRRLGLIDLTLSGVIPAADRRLGLFLTRHGANRSLPLPWIWSRYAYYAWKRRITGRSGHLPETKMNPAEERCLFVFYICPRPVMLATVSDGAAVNLVPLDLMGPVGLTHLALAVHTTSAIVPFVERSRRIALSSVPAEKTSIAYEMGRNHRIGSVDIARLGFPVGRSAAFGFPVPEFALRVREFEVEPGRAIGGYTLFLARLVKDERRADGLQFFLAHGFHPSRRAE
jgi:flavin reductase (DIM6/NTAB) family NADH-FMN oxidoreductase RutF